MSAKEIRMTYSDAPGRTTLVQDNPNSIFLVVGPFEDFSANSELMDVLEKAVRKHNTEKRK